MEKLRIELSIGENGKPIIRIEHYDKSNALEQLLFKKFLDSAREGINIKKSSSCSAPSIDIYIIETR